MHVNEIEVDISFSFYCPMTGELITGPEHYGPSPATAFLLGPEADEFDYISPELEQIWNEVRDAHDEGEQSPWQLFEEFCRRLDGHENLVLFSLTSCGIACGPVSSTVHVCIDFEFSSDDEDEEPAEPAQSQRMHASGQNASAGGEEGLPRHVPLRAFGSLLAAYERVAKDMPSEPEHDPIAMLVGYRDLATGEGFMALEYEGGEDEEPCGAPLERLENGEKLAIQLHDGWLADGVLLIDGKPYRPTMQEIRDGEAAAQSAGSDEANLFPDEGGFYALGVGIDRDRLTIEPIAVGCGMNGESLVRAAVFPGSLRRRVAAFLAALT